VANFLQSVAASFNEKGRSLLLSAHHKLPAQVDTSWLPG